MALPLPHYSNIVDTVTKNYIGDSVSSLFGDNYEQVLLIGVEDLKNKSTITMENLSSTQANEVTIFLEGIGVEGTFLLPLQGEDDEEVRLEAGSYKKSPIKIDTFTISFGIIGYTTAAPSIDWSNTLTDGLVGYWLMEDPTRDLTTNNDGIDVGSITRGTTANDKYAYVTNLATSNRINLGSIDASNPLSCSSTNEVSILAIVETVDTGADHGNTMPRVLDKMSSNIDLGGFDFYISYDEVGISGQTALSTALIPTAAFQAIGVTHSSGDTDLFLNGAVDSHHTNITEPLPATTASAAIGNKGSGSDGQYRKPIYMVAVWDRKLLNAEMVSLQNDPYQILNDYD